MEHEIKKRALIISGAPGPDLAYLKERIDPSDYIITADAGLKTCLDAGFQPDLAVGDFDTYQPDDSFQNIVRLPAEKDWTDTHHACKEAVARRFQEVRLFCTIGSRVDHTYANFISLHYLFEHGVQATMENRNTYAFITDRMVKVPKSDFRYLSLFALFGDVAGLTLRGVKYPLSDHYLSQSSLLCVSNEVEAEEAVISFQSGKLLVLLTND